MSENLEEFTSNELLTNFFYLKQKMETMEKMMEEMKKKDAVVIFLDSCRDLGEGIQKYLEGKVENIRTKFMRFGNNEVNTMPAESVRNKIVFIIGSGSNFGGTINDNLMIILQMVRACRDASAKEITVLCAYFPYCRSDKKDQGRAPISAKLVTDLFKSAGAQRLITVDLHAGQIQGFFDGPFDNLYAINYLIETIRKDYPALDKQNCVVVGPDAGSFKRTVNWATKLGGFEHTFLEKTRDHNKVSTIASHKLVDNLNLVGKTVIIDDDIGDSLGTLVSASKILKDKGATMVIAGVTHGVFSSKAFENLDQKYLDVIYVTNTLPQAENQKKSDKIRIVDISKLCADAIEACVKGTSVSDLFK